MSAACGSSDSEDIDDSTPDKPEAGQDPATFLNLALVNLRTDPELMRSLHQVQRSYRSFALANLQHLSLDKYSRGRGKVQEIIGSLRNGPVPPALAAAAAAVPPFPWGVLTAATTALTSLELHGNQVQVLLDGGPTATAAATTAAAAVGALSIADAPAAPAAAAAAGAPTAARSRLAATIAGLRQLTITIDDQNQVPGVCCLVGSCSSITKLAVSDAGLCDDPSEMQTSLDAYVQKHLKAAAGSSPSPSAAAAAAAAQVAPQAAAAAAAAAAGGTATRLLPRLRHLVLDECYPGCVRTWMDHLVVSGLTTLELYELDIEMPDSMPCWSACSGLQQLLLTGCPPVSDDADGPLLDPSRQLVGLTALTKLVVEEQDWGEGSACVVPLVVWELSRLRHLELNNPWLMKELPQAISSLQRLTHLKIGRYSGGLAHLPPQLSAWLPQLAVLELHGAVVKAIPPLPQLVHLDAGFTDISSMSAANWSTQITQLRVDGEGALEAVRMMGALKVLTLHMDKSRTLVDAPTLPCLQHLYLSWSSAGGNPMLLASQLIGSGRHLTYLNLGIISKQQEQGLEQLGVMPVLQGLSLTAKREAKACAPSEWLRQQPELTSLLLKGFHVGMLGQLPQQLQWLSLVGGFTYSSVGLAVSLQPLTNLRALGLNPDKQEPQPLPAWLSSLKRLQEVYFNESCTSGGEVLQQLPLLRRFTQGYKPLDGSMHERDPWYDHQVALLSACPHLCWNLRD